MPSESAQRHDTAHVLWDGVQDPGDPNAIFKLAFRAGRIGTCAAASDAARI
jgi:hypothetical protein